MNDIDKKVILITNAIQRVCDAAGAMESKGAQAPEDWAEIDQEYVEAKMDLLLLMMQAFKLDKVPVAPAEAGMHMSPDVYKSHLNDFVVIGCTMREGTTLELLKNNYLQVRERDTGVIVNLGSAKKAVAAMVEAMDRLKIHFK